MAEPNDTPVIPSQVVFERSRLSIPSLPNWIEPTVDYLRQKALLCGACHENRSGKLLIALHEALTNAIIHGNLEVSSELKERGDAHFAEALARQSSDPAMSGRKVDILVEFDGEVCQWTITDEGKGFDVERVLERCLSDDPEVLLSSGRGILMMKSFLDDVRFDHGGQRVILTLDRLSGNERRKDSRMPMNQTFQIIPLRPDGSENWAETCEAVSRNLSEYGASLLLKKRLDTQRILVGIPRNQEILYVRAEVMHTRWLGESGMELGCRFLPSLLQGNVPLATSLAVPAQVEEVQNAIHGLLENHQLRQLPSHNRRLAPRVVFNERVQIFKDHEKTPLIAYARDLSRSGIAMISQEPIAGEVTIAFSFDEEKTRLKARCRIVRCTRIQDGFHDLGATFLRLDRPSACEGPLP